MRISGIKLYSYQNFGTTYKKSSPIGNISNKRDEVYNTSWLLRDGIDWNWLAYYISFNFRDKPKVNVYSLACSDGSEPYSFVISLDENLVPRERNKFLPVYASDIDSEIIKDNKSGKFMLSTNDILKLSNLSNTRIDYFKNYAPYKDNFILCDVSQHLKENVIFKHSDILSVLKNIKDEGNTIIFCRNVFPYLNDNYKKEVLETISTTLKKGSLFIVGDFDCPKQLNEMLPENIKLIDGKCTFKVF